jgi:polysaccharide biosynthesis transport protein
VYRAVTVLTVTPKAVDMESIAADVENVAIQKRLLLGEELLGRLLNAGDEQGIDDVDALRHMLAVVLVPETNLLELRAEGSDPEQLHRLVNRWTESYEGFRSEEVEGATQRTTAELNEQQSELKIKIETTRAALLTFRETHDIVSLEREENSSLSALRGLNASLNKARETLIEARARKIAIEEAIANGETVIPREGQTEITRMQVELERTRARLNELHEKFTQRYIDRDPELAKLPATITELERDLAHALELGRTTMKDEAFQAVSAAEVSVATLEQQLATHQANVQQFTQRFKEFKSLEEGLTRLENLSADNAERIAQIQIRNQKDFPPLQVVQWAHVPTQAIYPNYDRDLMIALGAALAFALFVTWLIEYLGGRPGAGASAPSVGVRIYTGDQAQVLSAPDGDNRLAHNMQETARLADGTTHATEALTHFPVLPRELASAEIKALLTAVDPLTASYAVLLLCGVSPHELTLLDKACFDSVKHQINIPGVSQRSLEISPEIWQQLEGTLANLDTSPIAPDVDFQLVGAARSAHLADPPSINSLSLWHSYVVYLVRQGIDDFALINRVGAIPPEVHQALMQFAPTDGNRALSSINFIHPSLAA